MASTPCATASLMQVVCCWTSPLLSQTETLKPYFAAFFWYIFQEKACDGLSIWAMNISVGASAGRAPVDAPADAPGDDEAVPELHAPATRTMATRAVAPRARCLDI